MTNEAFDLEIIGTGSSGNSMMIDDRILIDMGLPYKIIGPYLEKSKAILITHRHGDHINLAALRRLYKNKPWKLNEFYANKDVANHIIDKGHNKSFTYTIPSSHIINDESDFELIIDGDVYRIETFKLDHDVENQGFVITKNNSVNMVYATDTSTMQYAPHDIKFDYIVVEGNYDETKIDDVLLYGEEQEVYRAYRNFRHLSIQKFWDYVHQVEKPSSEIYMMHESDTFGVNSGVKQVKKGRN